MMKKHKPSVYKEILARIFRYKAPLITSLVFTFFSVVFTLLVPVYIGRAIDNAIAAGKVRFDIIGNDLVIIAALTAAIVALQWLSGVLNNRIAYNVVRDLRTDELAAGRWSDREVEGLLRRLNRVVAAEVDVIAGFDAVPAGTR